MSAPKISQAEYADALNRAHDLIARIRTRLGLAPLDPGPMNFVGNHEGALKSWEGRRKADTGDGGDEGSGYESEDEGGEGPTDAGAEAAHERATRTPTVTDVTTPDEEAVWTTPPPPLPVTPVPPDSPADAFMKLPPEVRDKTADATHSIPDRIKALTTSEKWPSSGDTGQDIATRVQQCADKLAPEAATMVEATARKVAAEIEGFATSGGGTAGPAERALIENVTDALIAQEAEAATRTLGDHGIHHLEGDMRIGLAILAAKAEKSGADVGISGVSRADRLSVALAAVYHDTGYMTGPARNWADGDHPHWSSQHYDENVKPLVAAVMGQDVANQLTETIATHDAPEMDWDHAPTLSAMRLADNLALFAREKTPPLVKYVPGNRDVIERLATGAITKQQARAELAQNIAKTSLPDGVKSQLTRATTEVTGKLPKFIAGMWSGYVRNVGWDAAGNNPVVHIVNTGNDALMSVMDLGQRQFGKLAKTFGKTLDDFKNKNVVDLPRPPTMQSANAVRAHSPLVRFIIRRKKILRADVERIYALGGWVGVDFDRTLAYHDGRSMTDDLGAPIPAMVNRVREWLLDGVEVRIVSARATPGPKAAAQIARIQHWCAKHIGRVLPVTNAKDPEMESLWDDRAVGVVPNTGQPVTEADVASMTSLQQLNAAFDALTMHLVGNHEGALKSWDSRGRGKASYRERGHLTDQSVAMIFGGHVKAKDVRTMLESMSTGIRRELSDNVDLVGSARLISSIDEDEGPRLNLSLSAHIKEGATQPTDRDYAATSDLTFERYVDRDPSSGKLVVEHDLFFLPSYMQGHGVATEVLRESIKSYQALGVDEVHVLASGDNGAYTWARMGFLPTAGGGMAGSYLGMCQGVIEHAVDQDQITPAQGDALKAQMTDDPYSLWRLADHPLGKAVLVGRSWFGKLDLHNERQMARFNHYADQKLSAGKIAASTRLMPATLLLAQESPSMDAGRVTMGFKRPDGSIDSASFFAELLGADDYVPGPHEYDPDPTPEARRSR
jgi:hypothetical protein